jgi:membrane protein YdbS with pleckstrin-like domain
MKIPAGAMITLAGASTLALLADFHLGPPWVHWIGSLVALVAALAVVVIAERSWQYQLTAAKDAGLVAGSGGRRCSRAADFEPGG